MKKGIFILLLSFSFFVFDAQVANAQGGRIDRFIDVFNNSEVSINGLENADHKKVGLHISFAIEGKDASLFGLTEESIRRKCELRIRQAGLEPTKKETYLNVGVKVKSLGPSWGLFAVSLRFYRYVVFGANERTYYRFASTWEDGSVGEGGADFIISSLDRFLDGFLNEYLKANAK